MEKIAIGRIRSPHGVRGYLKIQSFSGEIEHFLSLKDIVLKYKTAERIFSIIDIKRFGASLLLKLRGIDTPEEGKRYSGWEIWVDKTYASPLASGEYYIYQMIGSSLIFNNNTVGIIIGVTDNGISDLLEVKGDKGSFIIPFTNEFVGNVNLKEHTIELKDERLLS